MNRLCRRALTSWIACLAILFGTLVPTLSHAFARAPQTAGFPVCRAPGHTVTAAKAVDAGPGASFFKHCPYCTDGHHAPGLLPQAPAALVAIGGLVLPSLFYQAPEPLFHWAAPSSRGPPVIS